MRRPSCTRIFERAVWPKERPAPLTWRQIPPDCADQIRRVRQRLGLTQTQLAARVGAARKAVVACALDLAHPARA